MAKGREAEELFIVDDRDRGAVEELARAKRDDGLAGRDAAGHDDRAVDDVGGFHRALARYSVVSDKYGGAAAGTGGGDERRERHDRTAGGMRVTTAEAD